MRLSNKLIQILSKRGFNAEKKHKINDAIDYLKKNNLPIFDKLLEYLEIFDGHQLIISSDSMKESEDEILTFDCIKINELEKGLEELYEETVEEELVMIGYNSLNYIFMMSISGKIYAGLDNILYFIGDNIEEALINLYEESNFKQLELKVEPCPFKNKIYNIKSSELEEYKNKFKGSFVMEIDGDKCKTWKDYIKEIDKKYGVGHYYKDTDHHAFYIIEWDHQFDLTEYQRDSYLLIINNYNVFLSKELDVKEIFEDLYDKRILHYFDNKIVKNRLSGDYKKFNLLLVHE